MPPQPARRTMRWHYPALKKSLDGEQHMAFALS